MRIDDSKLTQFIAREQDAYAQGRPVSRERAASSNGFFGGVPQHWMLDWATSFPMQVSHASGTTLTDIDGHQLTDLCLGDSGAMFGHSPPAVAHALRNVAEQGYTTMLPSHLAVEVSALLKARFGLPFWQITLSASDANRFALRAARAITGRKKVLVFDGCYHGAVDETAVDFHDGQTRAKPSLWGQAVDLSTITTCVPFNDFDAAQIALSSGDIACVIMEPALTNCGIVAPVAGFLDHIRKLTRQYGALLLIDETHTLSTGLGGWCAVHGLEPDIFVAGKAVAGGIAAGIWGLSDEVADSLHRVRREIPAGHSGVGTTLSGSHLQMAALRACLGDVMTQATYDDMIASAMALESAINAQIAAYDLPWCVVRIGARLETIFAPRPPINAVEMRASFNNKLEAALHLGMINRGFLVTPFHNMLLAGPGLPTDSASRYAHALSSILTQLT
ncbi:MAG: aminotransferase class III-fold pyridoxal phosphate-dependent enzyme [Hyphomonadaceae bacterium]|nr:aminotransferase class III-fold pyridoxal phosphate-dependent enzyme [Hyphomonadaceae bacterium]